MIIIQFYNNPLKFFFLFITTYIILFIIIFRYLGTGCTFQDLHYFFKLGASTIGNIVREVCNVVWEELAHIQMPPMTEDMWKDTAAKFEQRANFPHCLGAIDGKHIRIIKPSGTGSQHFNYKHYFSIVLLAIVDSNYKFVYVDIGSIHTHSFTLYVYSCNVYLRLLMVGRGPGVCLRFNGRYTYYHSIIAWNGLRLHTYSIK